MSKETLGRRTGDYAIIEIGAVQASQGDRLVGLSSKFLWYHPGPFYFYVLAPFQALLPEGGYALFAGAWFVAVGAFGAILYVLFGIGNRLLFLTLLFAISRYLYECPDKLLCLSPEEFLWTPYVTILPFWALLLFLADLPHRPALAVPACILACFVIQTHVGYFPVVGTMGLLSALFILERQWGDPFRSRKPTAGHSQRVGFWLSWTLVLGVLLWTPPVIEEITGYPGNLSALIGFFGDGTSLQHELGAVLYVFAQQSAAAISGLTGGAVEPRAQPWVVVLELVVLCAGLIASLRTRQRYLTGLQAHCLLALLVAGVSIMAIRGEVLHYLARISDLVVVPCPAEQESSLLFWALTRGTAPRKVTPCG